ncbi:MAG: lipid A export permease/ATP-binding protein MsbA [Gammaproteobacteria bacterium]|nr:lipid A export permease/ATP-binding protein MsbA [Gammaproteobacteria bacterium]MCF6362119.1 lipid A export permease/ATP-binding protein MsbA [Gammaproteobacteria bacterium]
MSSVSPTQLPVNLAEQQQTPGQIYRRLLGYAWRDWPILLFAILGMAVVAATETGFAWLMKPMLDGTFVDKDPAVIRWIPWALLGIFMVRGLASFVANYGMQRVGRNIVHDLRQQMFAKLMRLPTAFYDNNAAGQLTSKLIYDVERVASAATSALTVVVRDSLTILGLLGFMFYTNWRLAAVFLFLGPLITVLVVFISKRFRRISKRIQNSMGDVSQLSQQITEGHRVVKIFGGQAYEERQFGEANEYNRAQNMKMAITSALSVPISQFLGASGLAVILFIATSDAMLESLSVGTFMAFVTASMLLLPPMKRLTMIQSIVQQGIAAAQSVFSLLDEGGEKDTGTQHIDCSHQGRIEFRNVMFTYDPTKGRVLDDVSFSAEAGQVVAIVGRSGSGKSTLVGLLPRFYDLDSGEISLDGIPIQALALDSLRAQIALVSQDIILFNDTIGNNIAYGALAGADEAEVTRAAEAAHAMEFIRELPQGLDTLVGDKGVLLSGGQRQRIAIARALLKDAPILILDEATSALDSESERHIQAALSVLMKGRTTLVIAHRLSTVEGADRILVLRGGHIVESGCHADLLAAEGDYAALYHMQFNDTSSASAD